MTTHSHLRPVSNLNLVLWHIVSSSNPKHTNNTLGLPAKAVCLIRSPRHIWEAFISQSFGNLRGQPSCVHKTPCRCKGISFMHGLAMLNEDDTTDIFVQWKLCKAKQRISLARSPMTASCRCYITLLAASLHTRLGCLYVPCAESFT